MKTTMLAVGLFVAGFAGLGQASAQETQFVGLPNPGAVHLNQPSQSTCWAACDAMVLRGLNVVVEPAWIVSRVFGGFDPTQMQNAGADLEMPAAQMRGRWRTSNGQVIEVGSYVSYALKPMGGPPGMPQPGVMSPNDVQALLESLGRNSPVVIASYQHGRVCVGAYFDAQYDQPRLRGLVLLDPLGVGPSAVTSWEINQLGLKMNSEGGYLGMIVVSASLVE